MKYAENYKKIRDALIGGTIKEYGYKSTSLIRSVSYRLVNPIFIELFVPKGLKALSISPISSNPAEFEIVFPSDTEYQIKSIEIVPTKTSDKSMISDKSIISSKIKITAEVKLPIDEVDFQAKRNSSSMKES